MGLKQDKGDLKGWKTEPSREREVLEKKVIRGVDLQKQHGQMKKT